MYSFLTMLIGPTLFDTFDYSIENEVSGGNSERMSAM